MSRALPILFLVALTVFALVDCLQSDREQVPRKWPWVLLILLLPLVGPLAWLLAGRPRGKAPPPPRRAQPPVAPDDNPDFLRKITPPDDPRDTGK